MKGKCDFQISPAETSQYFLVRESADMTQDQYVGSVMENDLFEWFYVLSIN